MTPDEPRHGLVRAPERAARVEAARAALAAAAGDIRPIAVFVLGSGLGAWAETLERPRALVLSAVPGVPRPSIEGHAGRVVFGWKGALPVAAFAGRVHQYEGHSPADVTLALEAALALGARIVVLTNAAGAVNAGFAPGDLMVIDDHLNRTDVPPFRGAWTVPAGEAPAAEPRLRAAGRVYSRRLAALAEDAARDLGIALRRGVYHATSGPTYETPAEIRVAAALGADAVGMSTVAEAAVGAALGAEVLGLSCLTNRAAGLSATPLSHAEVIETAARVRGVFLQLLDALAARLTPGAPATDNSEAEAGVDRDRP